MIDSITRNPYNMVEYKKKNLKIFNSKKDEKIRTDLVDYLFDFQISGENDNNVLLLGTGFLANSKDSNYFILDEEDLDKLIAELESAKEKIALSKKVKENIKALHDQLNDYLDRGYVDHIVLEHRRDLLPPYFSKSLYKTFIIRPVFKDIIGLPPEINTAFNFIEVLHLDINEGKFDETMNYIRNYHDIPIQFIGYDHAEEIEKRKKEALKDLDKASKGGYRYGRKPEDIAKYKRMMEEMGIPINILNRKKDKAGS